VDAARFVHPEVELSFGLGFWYFQQQGDDAAGGDVHADVRWHLVERALWSFFLQGGVGVLVADDEVPASGLAFNFTPRFGVGFTARTFSSRARVRFAVGWQHVSNGFIKGRDDNPGRDALMASLALMLDL
jgi:hypothetical protein